MLRRTERLMNAQLDVPGAARLPSYLQGIGIQVVTSASVVRYEGAPILEVAQLAHGPRVNGDNGIRGDRPMRSSDPSIYALGDVAELNLNPAVTPSPGAPAAAVAARRQARSGC